MKERTKKNQNNKPRKDPRREETFTADQVVKLAQLITAGVMGIGGEECVKDATELPETLQKILISSILASRECMKEMIPSMLGSILAKTGK